MANKAQAEAMAMLLGNDETIELAAHAAKEAGLTIARIAGTAGPGKNGATLLMAQVMTVALIRKWWKEKGVDGPITDGLIEIADDILEGMRKKK